MRSQLNISDYDDPIIGKYYRHTEAATETERESGTEVEADRRGPIKPGKAEHCVLSAYAGGERMTAYEASWRATWPHNHHARRRESRRLFQRGFLQKSGTLPNPAQNGRPHVDAFEITESGQGELARLGGPVDLGVYGDER